nr:TIGR02594 family protein [Cognataquiflexum nitidum]
MGFAESQLGVREATNNNDGVDVEKYLKSAGLGAGYPWCGAFVNWSLKQAEIKGSMIPARALDWRNYGQNLSTPAFGSIGTLRRPGGGHVGFVAGLDADRPGWVIMLGGNQSNRVSYESFPIGIMQFNFPTRYSPSYSLPSMGGFPKGVRMQ